MKTFHPLKPLASLSALAFALVIGTATTFAHCDTMDGPVVKAAQQALASTNVNLVLIWVQPQDEAEVKAAFAKALAVRKLSTEARDLADRYFFETLVRVHRAGEGAPYIGLKPAGTDLGPAIPAADKALEGGSVEPLVKMLEQHLREGVQARFQEALAKKKFAPNDVAAGREYFKAYIEFVHYVEGIHESIANPPQGHEHEAVATAKGEETHKAAEHH
jgi:hypothetical protein